MKKKQQKTANEHHFVYGLQNVLLEAFLISYINFESLGSSVF